MAFDPKSPSTLYLSKINKESSITQTLSHETFQIFLSEDGIGCNAEETSALMKLLDARDAFYTMRGIQLPRSPIGNTGFNDMEMEEQDGEQSHNCGELRNLSRQYRKILFDCVQIWKDRVNMSQTTKGCESEDDTVENNKMVPIDEINLPLLERTLDVVHLSEIFLLSPLGYGNESSIAGIVTADTVRYLRSNQMDDIESMARHLLPDNMTFDQFLDLDQPEYYLCEVSQGQKIHVFWYVIRKLVLRGCLEEAWTILSHHSAYRRCVKMLERYHAGNVSGASGKLSRSTAFIDPTIQEDYEAFHLIKSILYSAPLPGGRNSFDDLGFAYIDSNVEEITTRENDMKETFCGVPAAAYKLWDIDFNDSRRTFDSIGSRAARETSNLNLFNLQAVHNLYKSWKGSVSNIIKTNASMKNLNQRIPMLERSLWAILLATKEIELNQDDSWAEVLASELIYIRPNLRKDDIHVRASAAVKKCLGQTIDDLTLNCQDLIIAIMRGNAGIVIEALYIFGGRSGAALPATQAALLCDLLMMANELRPSLLEYDLQTELVLNASYSIISSFAISKHHDVGIRLSTRLLSPYAHPDNVRVTAQLSESLSRHFPKSDAETDSLIAMCRDFVRSGSRRVLDACESLTICRATFYQKLNRFGEATMWLLKGIEVYHDLGTVSSSSKRTDEFSSFTSSNRSRLICMCLKVVDNLLECLVANMFDRETGIFSEQLVTCLKYATEIAHALSQDEINATVCTEPVVNLIRHLSSLGTNWVDGNNGEVAKNIVLCLEERRDSSGAVITLAHPLSYGHFMMLAFTVLKQDGNDSDISKNIRASFDVYGLQILLSRFYQWEYLEKYGYEIDCRNELLSKVKLDINDIREVFCVGLMRAFLHENTKLGDATTAKRRSEVDAMFNAHHELELMLSPSL